MAKKFATMDARRVFANLKHIHFTPWKDEATAPTAESDTYDITEVVADTTSLEQAENDINSLDHEFSSAPLYENIQLGDKTFTCESIDLQNKVLAALFGWKVEGDNVYAPVAYTDLYCTVEMAFNSTEDIVVLPKVKLNSRAVIASMKTDASRATISGTCYPAYVNGEKTDMAIIKGASEYTVSATEAGA